MAEDHGDNRNISLPRLSKDATDRIAKGRGDAASEYKKSLSRIPEPDADNAQIHFLLYKAALFDVEAPEWLNECKNEASFKIALRELSLRIIKSDEWKQFTSFQFQLTIQRKIVWDSLRQILRRRIDWWEDQWPARPHAGGTDVSRDAALNLPAKPGPPAESLLTSDKPAASKDALEAELQTSTGEAADPETQRQRGKRGRPPEDGPRIRAVYDKLLVALRKKGANPAKPTWPAVAAAAFPAEYSKATRKEKEAFQDRVRQAVTYHGAK